MSQKYTLFRNPSKAKQRKDQVNLAFYKNDNDILIPEYICTDVVESLVKAGYVIHYYELTPHDLYPKIENIPKIGRPAIFLKVHYFGYFALESTLIDFCSSNDYKIVNDCAQCFGISLSAYLKNFSDHFLIISHRKKLGMREGAIGYLPSQPTLHHNDLFSHSFFDFIRGLFKLALFEFNPRYFDYISKSVASKNLENSDSFDLCSLRVSILTSLDYCLFNVSSSLIRFYSRYKFCRISTCLSALQIEPLYCLDENFIPMYYVFTISDGTDVDCVVSFADQNNLILLNWPDLTCSNSLIEMPQNACLYKYKFFCIKLFP